MTPPEVTVSLTVRWTPREPGVGTLPTVIALMTNVLENLPATINSTTLDVYLEHAEPVTAPTLEGQDAAQ